LLDYLYRFINTTVGPITSGIVARVLIPTCFGFVGVLKMDNGLAGVFFNLGSEIASNGANIVDSFNIIQIDDGLEQIIKNKN
jgi:hypothetical protein